MGGGPPQLAESRSECPVPPHASHITVLVFPSFKRRVTQKRLRLVAEAALDAAAPAERGEVSVVIADDEALLELNARHRGGVVGNGRALVLTAPRWAVHG